MTKDASSEFAIKEEADIVHVRRIAREVSQRAGFSSTDVTRIVTACSEMARNIFKYAGNGNMRWRWVELSGRQGLQLVFQDNGPGIADINQAMQEGYTTSGGLGMGLPGAKRLVDEFEVISAQGSGTTITLTKWLRRPQ